MAYRYDTPEWVGKYTFDTPGSGAPPSALSGAVVLAGITVAGILSSSVGRITPDPDREVRFSPESRAVAFQAESRTVAFPREVRTVTFTD